MEISDVKAWLNRGRDIQKELDGLEQSKLNLYLRAVSMTQRYDGDAVSGSRDPHGKMDAYAQYADMVDRKAAELSTVSAEIFHAVCQVTDTRERTVLIRRYLGLSNWPEIAAAMSYDVRHVTRLHGKALLSVKEILEREQRCP